MCAFNKEDLAHKAIHFLIAWPDQHSLWIEYLPLYLLVIASLG